MWLITRLSITQSFKSKSFIMGTATVPVILGHKVDQPFNTYALLVIARERKVEIKF